MHRTESKELPDLDLLLLSSGRVRVLVFDNMYGILPAREAHLSLCVQSFYLAVHHIDTVDELIACVVNLSLQVN